MKIKLNVSMNGYKKGEEITIKDVDGIPSDPFWRRRLEDAEIDNCIKIVQTKSKSTKGVSS